MAMLGYALLAAVALVPVAANSAPIVAPVEVMVLGAYHFGNPGLDTHNVKVDSVLIPKRQRDLDRVAKALAMFRPTHVMVEMQSEAPDFAIAEYASFNDAMLAKEANEIVQIGYRTARQAGLKTVNGIDEQSKDGEPDYYPYSKVQETAAKFGQTAALEALGVPVVAWLKNFEAAQKTHSVGQMLLKMNDPAGIQGNMDSYYGMLAIGDRDAQTGADLNAAWYLRNAKIFGKLMQVAKPGDRVLVVYGGGHGFWLRHFAGLVPGYRNVDVLPYLAKAK
ncbi:DUF5694 domain-containing protein [Sandarakinorhabdus glacialis]|nr:DUF5694 domain-containing protein [Polymorphobacter glacialis]